MEVHREIFEAAEHLIYVYDSANEDVFDIVEDNDEALDFAPMLVASSSAILFATNKTRNTLEECVEVVIELLGSAERFTHNPTLKSTLSITNGPVRCGVGDWCEDTPVGAITKGMYYIQGYYTKISDTHELICVQFKAR